MTIEVSMSGSGTIGPIAPGWRVRQAATPVVIGERSSGTGTVTFNAAAREDSLFIVNNSIVTVDENLGQFSGVVNSVSQNGINVSVTHNTKLALFDATKNIPALGAGGVVPALDLCSQLSGSDVLLSLTSGRFYSLRGHSAGFDSDGIPVEPVVSDGSYIYYNPSTGNSYPIYYREQYGSIWANSFTVIDETIWSRYVIGDTFSNNRAIPSSRIAFKTILDDTNNPSTSFSFLALPDDSNTGSGQAIGLTIDYATQKMYLTGDYREGGILRAIDAFTDFPVEIDFDAEFAIFLEYSRPTSGNTYRIEVRACNTSDYSNYASIVVEYDADISNYNDSWYISGNVRSIYRDQGVFDIDSWLPVEYENPVSYVNDGAVELFGPVPAKVNANMWEYLQDACSAYHKEISVYQDTVSVRNIGEREIDITNVAGSPTITPTVVFSGRSVEINYSNAFNVDNQELYNAFKDNNRVISVNASETISTTVEIDGTPTVVQVPQRSTVPPSGLNEYSIVDSNGLQIPQELWETYGGRLNVSLNMELINAIDITLTGPSSSDGTFNEDPLISGTPLYPGPYKLAYTADGTDYASLSIIGSGVRTRPNTLTLLTGADPTKVVEDVAKTVDNSFIVTEAQAYDRGAWASLEASGPRVVVSGSIPADEQIVFGLTAGSRIRYRDSIYRITEVNIGNLAVDFTAVRHVTVADFDALWSGKSVGLHDGMWEGYDNSDHIIAPLRFIGDDEPVVMFLDDDVNPYYDFEGEPEISVFPDTDFNPYYEDGGNLDGEDPVYLDVDENPYDGGEGYGS